MLGRLHAAEYRLDYLFDLLDVSCHYLELSIHLVYLALDIHEEHSFRGQPTTVLQISGLIIYSL